MKWHGWMKKSVAAAALAAVMTLCGACAGVPKLEEPEEYVPTASELEKEAAQASYTEGAQNTRETQLYYRDASGYIIPVMRTIPWSEGMGEVVLSYLTAGTEDDLRLAARGLIAPLPEGTESSLYVEDGVAHVDLRFTGGTCATKEDECAMLISVVNSLMEFSTVDTVQLTIDGNAVDSLPLGTPVETAYTEPLINVEPMGAPMNREGKLQLYFANEVGSYLVPVWRIVDTQEATPATAVEELISPVEGSGLVSLLPPACQVVDVTVDPEGTAQVNFSEEFMTLSAMPNMERLAMRGLTLTLAQFEEIQDIQICVEGIPYEPSVATWAQESPWLNVMQ